MIHNKKEAGKNASLRKANANKAAQKITSRKCQKYVEDLQDSPEWVGCSTIIKYVSWKLYLLLSFHDQIDVYTITTQYSDLFEFCA